jgi:hypothetical protein
VASYKRQKIKNKKAKGYGYASWKRGKRTRQGKRQKQDKAKDKTRQGQGKAGKATRPGKTRKREGVRKELTFLLIEERKNVWILRLSLLSVRNWEVMN